MLLTKKKSINSKQAFSVIKKPKPTPVKQSDGWWAPIWSGLVLDPKHQMQMDRAIWVYLYLQTYAGRKTGWLFRKYQDIADETGRSFNTIRRHMEKLESLGYIEMTRKQYGFEIQITKWKPITTPKLDSEDGQCEPNEPVRLPKGEHSENGQTAHPEVSDCPRVGSLLIGSLKKVKKR